MKLFTTILTAATLATGVASADDAANASWIGPYAGLNMGTTAMHAHLEMAATTGWWTFGRSGDGELSPSGPVLGVQAGYNFALGSDMVSGVELSYTPDQVSETIASPTWPNLDTWAVSVENVVTLSGRIGKVYDNRLVYVTSGLTSAKIDSLITTPNDHSRKTHLGFMVGAGVEFEVSDKTLFAVEYKYSDFGSALHPYNTACGPCSAGDNRTIDVTAHTISAKVNFRF